MARNAELIRAILRQPDDDTVRLVYADWLDENDDPKHAELIRVQCAGTRRKQFAKREAELLADPGFHLSERQPFQYSRGFIRDDCTLTFAGQAIHFESFFMASIGAPPQTQFCFLQSQQVAVLDRVLNLNLCLRWLPVRGPKWDDPFVTECLRRVTNLKCWEDSPDPKVMKRLTKCPHLSGVESISFQKAVVVPLGLIADLFLSSALPNVTSIHLDGEEWLAHDDSPVEDEHVAEFIARIGASKKVAQLTYLQLNETIGPQTAQALLDAPHLKPSEQLCLFMNRGLNKAMKAALKKKFGKALRM